MIGPTADRVRDRLHLQHGPIDLIIGADGARHSAFDAAEARFGTILQELVDELPDLRRQISAVSPIPNSETGKRMHAATMPHAKTFVTAMAAVAGSVADTIITAIKQTNVTRAYVNNGGDIAVHLTDGAKFTLAMVDHQNQSLGRVALTAHDGVGGIATSGRHGRSLSLGIADSVTVLARTAATADVAATLIANAVDLPDHQGITRRPAEQIQDDSDLAQRLVVTDVAPLTVNEVGIALDAGHTIADEMLKNNQIVAAVLYLGGQSRMVATTQQTLITNRTPSYA
jgi:ApbE superfamily uncharacterized protein (UPF0280 family)